MRFNREARSLLRNPANAEVTLGNYAHAHGFEGNFARYYLNPMAASVWSTSLEEIGEFPVFTLFRVLDNHGLLGLTTQAQWYVLKGGSSVYVAPLTAPYKQRIQVGTKIEAVTRTPAGVQIAFGARPPEQFEEAVFACHAPQTMQLLKDATPLERRILENFRTSRNRTVLHTDSRLLPRRPSARASWNYHLGTSSRSATLTYHMNRLQGLPTREDYCVTLNNAASLDERHILRAMEYFHPLYNIDAVPAQARWSEISGHNHTHFCGAYWFYSFHEDGLNSAIRVAEKLGVSWEAAA